jgi:hypothetical protein
MVHIACSGGPESGAYSPDAKGEGERKQKTISICDKKLPAYLHRLRLWRHDNTTFLV